MYKLLDTKIYHIVNIYYKSNDINHILKALETQIIPEPIILNKFFKHIYTTINTSSDFLKFLILLIVNNNYLNKIKHILKTILQNLSNNDSMYINKNIFYNDNFLSGVVYNIFNEIDIIFDALKYKITINNKKNYLIYI
ncbi:hypothetical protein [Hypsugopox virus]|nr:hypothetical protein [Hypsugopox virus]